jgi:hypothetical protein
MDWARPGRRGGEVKVCGRESWEGGINSGWVGVGENLSVGRGVCDDACDRERERGSSATRLLRSLVVEVLVFHRSRSAEWGTASLAKLAAGFVSSLFSFIAIRSARFRTLGLAGVVVGFKSTRRVREVGFGSTKIEIRIQYSASVVWTYSAEFFSS